MHCDRMNRRTFVGLVGGTALVACARPLVRPASTPAAIRAVAFDLFTIFDPRGIDHAVASETADPELASLWKRRAFEYCWLRAAAAQYAPFDQIVVDALAHATRSRKLELSVAARGRLIAAWTELQPWPDAPLALAQMRDAGLVLAPLANFAPSMIERLLEHSRLRSLFSHVLSTDRARTFKPAAAAYRLGVDVLGLPAENIAFSAFGGWDAVGATWFGYPTFWVDRFGGVFDELSVTPAGRGPDLRALATWIAQR
jgi:2-haloacid dehalogenase